MKIAVFHNFMDNIGGAEMVVLAMARGLDADIFTTNIDPEKIKAMGYADVLPRIKTIGKVPVNAPWRHEIALWKFRNLNVKKRLQKKDSVDSTNKSREYDCYIIAGDWAMSGAVHNKPNIWYTHSPLNELWQFRTYVRQELMPFWKRPLYDLFVLVNRFLTRRYARHIDTWVCNSKNVQDRVKRFYGKEPGIIYPPIQTEQNRDQGPSSEYQSSDPSKSAPQKYWLSVNRLAAHKRVDMQMKAFAKMPDRKLIIVGSFEKGSKPYEEYKTYLEGIKTDNVEIIHWADSETLKKLYAECTGFITTAKDEDFGMTPLEAMAAGKPVLASNEGGYKETVLDGITGVLVDATNSEAIINGVHAIEQKLGENPEAYRKACLDRAAEFDTKVFIAALQKVVNETVEKDRVERTKQKI